MNRGSGDPRFHVEHVAVDASMRPRFMNRGSQDDLRVRQAHQRASMRPRFMNRGSRPHNHSNSRIMCRFNEAPIHESGK